MRVAYLQYHYTAEPRGGSDSHPAAVLFEPAAFVRIGPEELVLELQLGCVLSTGSDAAPATFPLVVSAGLRAMIDFDRQD